MKCEASCMYVLKMKCVHHLCPMVACVSMSCDHVLKASPTNTLFQCTMPVLMCCSLSTVWAQHCWTLCAHATQNHRHTIRPIQSHCVANFPTFVLGHFYCFLMSNQCIGGLQRLKNNTRANDFFHQPPETNPRPTKVAIALATLWSCS